MKLRVLILFLLVCILGSCKNKELGGGQFGGCQSGERWVASSPAMTAMLFELGYGGCLVGTSDDSREPVEVEKLARVGRFLSIQIEAVLRLKPSRVFLESSEMLLAEQLEKMGIGVEVCDFSHLEGIWGCAERLGGGRWVRQMKGAMEKKCLGYRGVHQGQKVLMVIWDGGKQLSIAQRHSYLGELGSCLGYEVLGVGEQAWGGVNLEQVILLNPDKVIYFKRKDENRDDIIRLWQSRFDFIRKYRVGDFIFMDAERDTIPGVRILEVLEAMGKNVAENPDVE